MDIINLIEFDGLQYAAKPDWGVEVNGSSMGHCSDREGPFGFNALCKSTEGNKRVVEIKIHPLFVEDGDDSYFDYSKAMKIQARTN